MDKVAIKKFISDEMITKDPIKNWLYRAVSQSKAIESNDLMRDVLYMTGAMVLSTSHTTFLGEIKIGYLRDGLVQLAHHLNITLNEYHLNNLLGDLPSTVESEASE